MVEARVPEVIERLRALDPAPQAGGEAARPRSRAETPARLSAAFLSGILPAGSSWSVTRFTRMWVLLEDHWLPRGAGGCSAVHNLPAWLPVRRSALPRRGRRGWVNLPAERRPLAASRNVWVAEALTMSSPTRSPLAAGRRSRHSAGRRNRPPSSGTGRRGRLLAAPTPLSEPRMAGALTLQYRAGVRDARRPPRTAR